MTKFERGKMIRIRIDVDEIRSIARPSGQISEGKRYDFGEGEEMVLAVQILGDRIWILSEFRELIFDLQGNLISSTRNLSSYGIVGNEHELPLGTLLLPVEDSSCYRPCIPGRRGATHSVVPTVNQTMTTAFR